MGFWLETMKIPLFMICDVSELCFYEKCVKLG